MLARALPGILPRHDRTGSAGNHASFILSPADWQGGLMTAAAVSAPHHTTSAVALIGGGRSAMPGEISKAHNGVLFLDELPEYPPRLCSKRCASRWRMARSRFRASMRAAPIRRNFQLVCAMNPCPCGNLRLPYAAPAAARRTRCSGICTRISGPLLDRIDMARRRWMSVSRRGKFSADASRPRTQQRGGASARRSGKGDGRTGAMRARRDLLQRSHARRAHCWPRTATHVAPPGAAAAVHAKS